MPLVLVRPNAAACMFCSCQTSRTWAWPAGISELQGLADEYRKLSSDARGLQVDHDTDPETQASAALDAAQAQLEHQVGFGGVGDAATRTPDAPIGCGPVQISTMQVLTQRIADLEVRPPHPSVHVPAHGARHQSLSHSFAQASQQALQAETSSATVRSSNLRPLAQVRLCLASVVWNDGTSQYNIARNNRAWFPRSPTLLSLMKHTSGDW